MIEVRRRYRYTVQDRDRHGNVRVYLRQPGKQKVRLLHEPGTPEFDVEYRQAIAGDMPAVAPRRVAATPGSLRALCIAYFGSAEAKQLEARSRHVRRLILEKLCERHGDKPVTQMEPRHVRSIRDARADQPEAANGIVKALRAVFRHGMLAGLAVRNPAKEVEYLRSGSEGFHTWTPDEVRQFEAYQDVGSKVRLALALLLYTGQRRSDVVQLGRQHLRDGWLTFTQTKNRKRKPVALSLPVVPELRRIIDATPTGHLAFLVSDRGTPYTPDSFGNRFRPGVGKPGCRIARHMGFARQPPVGSRNWAVQFTKSRP